VSSWGASLRGGPLLYSRPIPLHWAGWTSDTYSLQKAGWSLSAEQDVYRNEMRLALRHEDAGFRGITQGADFDYQAAIENPTLGRLPTLFVERMAAWLHVRVPEGIQLDAFRPIDAVPQIRAIERWKSIDDLVHFAPAAAQQQLVLPEETVPELLEKIVAMQAGARLERFREQVREQQQQPALVHAQIVSFRRAA
jgi:hypothetical protein